MPELLDLVQEANRQFAVCNACRYCEGYCAVFPAAESRSEIGLGDLALLSNLCHDCRACYQACMFTPPHEFDLNIPTLLSDARLGSYRHYTWPGVVRRLFLRPGRAAIGASLVGLALVLLAVALHGGLNGLLTPNFGPGSFYRLIAYEVMVASALVLTALAVLAVAGGFWTMWRDTGGTARQLLDVRSWWRAVLDTVALRNLGGGGDGCYYPEAAVPSHLRRGLHQSVLLGFVLSFGATVAAAFEQDILGIVPPYPLLSAPVLMGAVGGVLIIVGCTGLLVMRWRQPSFDRGLASPVSRALSVSFLLLLEWIALSGMLLLALRDTPAMGVLLVTHLAAVAGLFVTAPYGKLAHAVPRFAALWRGHQT